MLKLCSLGSAWIVTHFSSIIDAAFLAALPEQMETSLVCLECVARPKDATRVETLATLLTCVGPSCVGHRRCS